MDLNSQLGIQLLCNVSFNNLVSIYAEVRPSERGTDNEGGCMYVVLSNVSSR